jgi:hypothetical protein
MSRAWPFENQEEKERFREPRDFLAKRDGCEAVVVRIGLHDAQLVLVDGEGAWDRWVYHSEAEAKEIAESLGDIPVHVGEYPEALRVKINSHPRRPSDFDDGAYPEQGEVGPVNPYPENRPRRLEVLLPEKGADSEKPAG